MTEQEWLTTEHVGSMLRYLTHEVHVAEDAVGDHRREHPLISQRQVTLFDEACWERFRLNVDDAAVQSVPPAGAAALLRCIRGNPFRPVSVGADPASRRVHDPFVAVRRLDSGLLQETPAWLTPTVLSLAQAAYDERLDDGTLDPFRLAMLADALEEAGCPSEEEVEITCPGCNGVGQVGTLSGTFGCVVCSRDYKSRGTGKQKVKQPAPVPSHLRSPGVHVRGCFALDLIIGKGW